MEIKNKYSCAPAIWKKYSEPQRKIWNGFYEAFNSSPNYPEKLTATEIEIIAHNLACRAVWDMPELLIEAIKK